MDGIINVYKERGFTSHDVVAKLRGVLKQRKIGHTGTLDPDAEGVLPVCLGTATKLCDFLTDKDKIYRGVLLLGRETDTQDVSGRTLEEKPVTVTEDEIRDTISRFIGPYEQVPPMYSALKVDGKKLYELAREGKTIERRARMVMIHEICIEEICLPRVTITVHCSKGTYIRTLCHDIGKYLGCGGCMESLLRTRTGRFCLEDSLTLSEIEKLRDEGSLCQHITAVDDVFMDYPKVTADREHHKMLYNGNPMGRNQFSDFPKEEGKDRDIRVYDADDTFMGIYRYDAKTDRYRPVKLFYHV